MRLFRFGDGYVCDHSSASNYIRKKRKRRGRGRSWEMKKKRKKIILTPMPPTPFLIYLLHQCFQIGLSYKRRHVC